MKHIQIILLAIVSLYTISCEDVIDIELNSVEPRIVIEAKLYDKFFPASVIITKTTDFFDTISFNKGYENRRQQEKRRYGINKTTD